VSSITKKHVLLHLAPQLPIAYSPTLQTHIIIAIVLLMIFMTAVNDIHDWCNPLPTCLVTKLTVTTGQDSGLPFSSDLACRDLNLIRLV